MARPTKKALPSEVPEPLWARLGHVVSTGAGTYGSTTMLRWTAMPVILSPLAEDPEFTHRGVVQCGRCGAKVTISKMRTPSKASRLAWWRFWLIGLSVGLLLSVAGVMTFSAKMPGTTAAPGMLTTAFIFSALFCLWAIGKIIGDETSEWGVSCDPDSMTLLRTPAADDECTHQPVIGEGPCPHWVKSPSLSVFYCDPRIKDSCNHGADFGEAHAQSGAGAEGERA